MDKNQIRLLDNSEIENIAAWIGSLKRPGFSWSEGEWRKSAYDFKVYGLPGSCFILFQELADSVEILALGTHPDRQRQALMRNVLLNFYSFLDSKFTEIWLEVHAENLPARLLYESLGFQQVGERPHYYGPGETAILMTKRLPRE